MLHRRLRAKARVGIVCPEPWNPGINARVINMVGPKTPIDFLDF
jgi:hypothetical protein